MTDRSDKTAANENAKDQASVTASDITGRKHVGQAGRDKTSSDTDNANDTGTIDSPGGEPLASSSENPSETLLPGQWDSEGNSVAAEPGKGSAKTVKDNGTLLPVSQPRKRDVPDLASRESDPRGSEPLPPAGPETATIDIPPEFTATADVGMSRRTGFQTDGEGETLRDNLPGHVGKYRVVSELGRGAFGVVYLAKDEDIDRDVAIKLSLVEDAHYQERLMVEASKVAKVAGEHIVPVLHVDRTEFGAVYIVQRFIDGCTLSTLMESEEEITPGQAMILIYQLALGLKTAHKQDILHRDLKPDNILLDSSGVPWIVDFGIAISEDEQLERRRELAGTPPYMSPEQIMGRVDFMDARSDIWALGVVFYEMLTGKLPFTGRSRKELTEQICKRDPKPVQQHSPEMLTDEMNTVFRQCCAKEPIDRFATVDELAAAMRKLIETYATVDDLEIPLGINVKPGTGSQSSTRAGLGMLATGVDGATRSTQLGQTQTSIPTVTEQASNYLLKIASTAAIAAVVVIGFIVRDQLRPPGDPDGGNPTKAAAADDEPKNADPDLVAYVPGSGPRLVAQSGPAHHRTIQQAIDAASGEKAETIEIEPGFYHESLLIEKSVRLVAAQSDQKPELLGSRNALLTVSSDGGTITIEGLSISASAYYTNAAGMESPAKFNAISVKRGTLIMKDCQVSKASFGPDDNYNGVRVFQGGFLSVEDCTFLPTPGFAITGVDHRDIRVSESRFNGDGVQLVGGSGTVRSCEFKGERGVQVQQSGNRIIDVTDCKFVANREWSLNVSAAGSVRSSKNEFNGCTKAVWVGAQDEAMDMVGNAGQLTMQTDTLVNCLYAVNVDGGAVTMESDCSIQGGRKGVLVTLGNFTARDLDIKDCQEEALHTILKTRNLLFKNVNIENCGDQGLYIEACESLDLRSVTISQIEQFGMYVAKGNVSVDGLRIRDAQMGIALMREAQSDELKAIDVKDCKYGFYVKPARGFEIDLQLTDSRFENCSKVAIYAQDETNIGLKDVNFVGFEGRIPYLASKPASIRLVE